MPEEKDNDLNNKDRILGRLLAREIEKSAIPTECPPAEDIAAFIEGKLSGKAKDKMMGHLASCNDCYAILSASVKTEELMHQKSRAWIQKIFRPYYMIPSAIAAAALVIIIIKLTTQTSIPQFTQKPDIQPPVIQPAKPSELHPPIKPEGKEEKEKPLLPQPVYYAMVDLGSEAKNFLIETKGDSIQDKKAIAKLLKALKTKPEQLNPELVKEVKLEWPESQIKSLFREPKKAEIQLKNGVLIIKVIE